jgi:hypothetical protein
VCLSSRAEAPVIRDVRGAMLAKIVPAAEWCGPVVSVELHASRQIFEKKPEEVQRFVGAIRAGMDYDCPAVEVIRIRGFAGKAGIFLAYTAKESDWSIKVFTAAKGVLSMLAPRDSSATALRQLAYFETKVQFDRAKLENVIFEAVESGEEADHIAWRIEGIQGATYVVTDRRAHFRSFDDVVDAAAHIIVDRCVNDSGGMPLGAMSRKILPNAQLRSFECVNNNMRAYVSIVTKEVDDMVVIFSMSSDRKLELDTLVKFLADKGIMY